MLINHLLRTFIAKVILFIQYVLLNNRSVWYNDFRPETGLRMNDHPIPQDHTGSYDSIIFDTAMFADVRVVVHDATRDRAGSSPQ